MSYIYELSAYRYGSEHTTGTMPNSVTEYWLEKGPEDFGGLSMPWDRKENYTKIPKQFQLNEWSEIDNIMHECTVALKETFISLSGASGIMPHRHGDSFSDAQGSYYWIYEYENSAERKPRIEPGEPEIGDEDH